ncbi:uncharacterized protein LOC135828270 [Sycon ciliatum]|uniref:uncharacterized protein LOC135828270 n=1 Tax=Sycon ciliatum TaxID=27933 RepID=UPI0031F645C1
MASANSSCDWSAGLTDPVNLIPTSVLVLCVAISGLPRNWTAAWALFNAVMIHAFLDGVVGGMLRGPDCLVKGYMYIDDRFTNGDGTIGCLCWLELYMYTPLAMIWYHSENTKAWHREFFGIVLSVIYLMGNLFYIFAEAYLGFPDVPLDWPPKFDTYDKIVKFWGIYLGANSIWVFIPLIIIYRGWVNIGAAFKQANGARIKSD